MFASIWNFRFFSCFAAHFIASNTVGSTDNTVSTVRYAYTCVKTVVNILLFGEVVSIALLGHPFDCGCNRAACDE